MQKGGHSNTDDCEHRSVLPKGKGLKSVDKYYCPVLFKWKFQIQMLIITKLAWFVTTL